MLRTIVAPVHHRLVAYGTHAVFGTVATLRRLVAGADLVVVDGIVFAVLGRRKIWHHHVGSSHYSPLPPQRMERTQRRSGRKQHMRVYQPYDREESQRGLHTALRLVSKRGVVGWYERTYADHVRLERAYELEILI